MGVQDSEGAALVLAALLPSAPCLCLYSSREGVIETAPRIQTSHSLFFQKVYLPDGVGSGWILLQPFPAEQNAGWGSGSEVVFWDSALATDNT